MDQKKNSASQDHEFFNKYFRDHPKQKTDNNDWDSQLIEIAERTTPFYEVFLDRWPLPYFVSSFILIVPMFILHLTLGSIYHVNTFIDYSWFLSLMTGCILVLVIWATKNLRQFVIDLYSVFHIPLSENFLLEILRKYLSNSMMIRYGFIFGTANTAFGLFYGVWYGPLYLNLSLLFQIFVVGFVCGLAICGIVGVIDLILHVSSGEKKQLDFVNIDNCGGTAIIGNSLLKFAAVSLLAGLMIAFYIYNSPWTNRDWPPVLYSIYLWMGFPHLAAITVLLIPIQKIHGMIRTKKVEREDYFIMQREEIRRKILQIADDRNRPDEKKANVYYTQNMLISEICKEVREVREWPFEKRNVSSFAISYVLSFIVPAIQIWRTLSDLLH